MHRLSETSALVLCWAGNSIHRSPASNAYLSKLDVKAAAGVFKECNAIWPSYGEVIKNRKHAILQLAKNILSGATPPKQVVILAAGFDALSLEIASSYPDIAVFDTDRENMPEKAVLIRDSAPPEIAGQIHCVSADMADSAMLQSHLAASGWEPLLPSLVIVEGISYYLPENILKETLKGFRAAGMRTDIILEYLVPEEQVAPERREIPNRVFQALGRRYRLAQMTTYHRHSLAAFAEAIHCEVQASYTMHDMESHRLPRGSRRFFSTPDSGWIEIALLTAR